MEVKPVSEALLAVLREKSGIPVVTIEEGVVPGGFGGRLRRELDLRPFHEWGYPDRFIEQGTPEEQDEDAGMSSRRLEYRLRSLLP